MPNKNIHESTFCEVFQPNTNANDATFCAILNSLIQDEYVPYKLNKNSTQLKPFDSYLQSFDKISQEEDKICVLQKPFIKSTDNCLNTYEMILCNVSYDPKTKKYHQNNDNFGVLLFTTMVELDELKHPLEIISVQLFCGIPYSTSNQKYSYSNKTQYYDSLKSAKCKHVYVDDETINKVFSLIDRTLNAEPVFPNLVIDFAAQSNQVVLLDRNFVTTVTANNYVSKNIKGLRNNSSSKYSKASLNNKRKFTETITSKLLTSKKPKLRKIPKNTQNNDSEDLLKSIQDKIEQLQNSLDIETKEIVQTKGKGKGKNRVSVL